MAEPNLISLAWPDIVKLAFTAGFFTAVFNQAVGWLKDLKKEQRDQDRIATYSALRVSIVLERFALACALAVDNIDLFKSSFGNSGIEHPEWPKIDTFSAEIEWKMLDSGIAARALTLSEEVELASSKIQAVWDVTSDEELAGDARYEALGKCGIRAWRVASDARRKYKLPIFDPKELWWDAVATLERVATASEPEQT